MIAGVGSSVNSSKIVVDIQEENMMAKKRLRLACWRVNLDTEAVPLIEFQQAYQASARILSTARELFQSLMKFWDLAMQVSTKLLNQQLVRQFSKINDKIADAQERISPGKIFCGRQMILLLVNLSVAKEQSLLLSQFVEISNLLKTN